MKANIFKKTEISLLIGFLLFLSSCNSGCNGNKLDINVSNVEVNVGFERFDVRLMNCKSKEEVQLLQQSLTSFYNDFVFKIMRFEPNKNDSLCLDTMMRLIQDNYFISLFDSSQVVFKEDQFLKDGIMEAMKHFRYYFKTDSIPQFITFNSFFKYQNVIGEGYVGIGLDMYLGENYVYYTDTRLDFPQYLIEKFRKEYTIRNTIKYFIEQQFEIEASPIFIERAVQQGKIYFLLDALCPQMPDSIKIKYSNEKLSWIKTTEKEMWVDFVNRKVLFSKNAFENDKYFLDGPFTNVSNVSRDSPPRVGEWLGWQIVKKYMNTHPKVTLQELMHERDLMKIYKESGYRPK